jgi:hypothetical protein
LNEELEEYAALADFVDLDDMPDLFDLSDDEDHPEANSHASAQGKALPLLNFYSQSTDDVNLNG